jgi:DNA-binding LacI/PurR family transcriptional regulator
MGIHAAEILLERIGQTRSLRPRKILIPPKLVERESTRRMP